MKTIRPENSLIRTKNNGLGSFFIRKQGKDLEKSNQFCFFV